MITQGKWEVKDFNAVRVDIGVDNNCLLFGINAESNARLIAGAPELLTACKDLIFAVEVCDSSETPTTEDVNRLHNTIADSRTTIAKAE